jgi:hypothetical protein
VQNLVNLANMVHVLVNLLSAAQVKFAQWLALQSPPLPGDNLLFYSLLPTQVHTAASWSPGGVYTLAFVATRTLSSHCWHRGVSLLGLR